jgi:hypothetical protein
VDRPTRRRPGQLDAEPAWFVGQDRFRQGRLIAYGTEHGWSHSLQPKGLGLFSLVRAHSLVQHASTFQVEVVKAVPHRVGY